MALYEYHCAENGRTVEVRHGMNEALRTWGEVCDAAGLDPADTPAHARVERLMSTAAVGVTSAPAPQQGCGGGCACFPEA